MLKEDITLDRKLRHKQMQEDFTPDSVCEDLYALLPKDFGILLDTSCGTGNLLVYVFKQRIKDATIPKHGIDILKSLHGIDIIEDNVIECRRRLREVFVNEFKMMSAEVEAHLEKNIQCGDYLEMRASLDFVRPDTILQNPPYKKGLYIKFLDKAVDDAFRYVVSIQPAAWLMSFLKDTPKGKMYQALKKKIDNVCTDVVIENYNQEFNTGLYTPHSIIKVDKDDDRDEINASIIGVSSTISTLDDANLIGSAKLVHSILDKCKAYHDKMSDHIMNKKTHEGEYFAKYMRVIGRSFCGDPRSTDGFYVNELLASPCFYTMMDTRYGILDHPHLDVTGNKVFENQVVGAKEELENWQNNIMRILLFPFLGIALCHNQNNMLKEYCPFVKEPTTSDQLYDELSFTEEERRLIDDTVTKYMRQSPFYKRLQYGKN